MRDNKLESQHVFTDLRKALYDREDEVAEEIDEICSEQKEVVMNISSLKSNLRILIHFSYGYVTSEESNYDSVQKKTTKVKFNN